MPSDGRWSRHDPSTEWIQDGADSEFIDTTLYQRSDEPIERDDAPTLASDSPPPFPGLPIGLREHPRTNRPAVSVEPEQTEAPMPDSDPRVVGYLASIDKAAHKSATADARFVEIVEDGVTMATRLVFIGGGVLGLLAFLGMLAVCGFLLLGGG